VGTAIAGMLASRNRADSICVTVGPENPWLAYVACVVRRELSAMQT
jgi:hypothetical protein